MSKNDLDQTVPNDVLEARRKLEEMSEHRQPKLTDVAPTTIKGCQQQIDLAKALLLSRTHPDVVEAVEHLISMSLVAAIMTMTKTGGEE